MLDTRKDAIIEQSSCISLLLQRGLSNADVGAASGTVLQEIRPGAGFKTGDFVKEELDQGYGIVVSYSFIPPFFTAESSLSYYHTIILSYYHTIILSYYHTIILSYYHTIIPSSYYHTIILSHYHTIIL